MLVKLRKRGDCRLGLLGGEVRPTRKCREIIRKAMKPMLKGVKKIPLPTTDGNRKKAEGKKKRGGEVGGAGKDQNKNPREGERPDVRLKRRRTSSIRKNQTVGEEGARGGRNNAPSQAKTILGKEDRKR